MLPRLVRCFHSELHICDARLPKDTLDATLFNLVEENFPF